MYENVALSNRVEDRVSWIAQLRRSHRHERRVAQLGDLHRCQPHEIAQVEQRSRLDHVGFRERRHFRRLILQQLGQNEISQIAWNPSLYFDADYFSEATLEYLLLDLGEEIIVFIGVGEIEIGVPRYAEHAEAADFHPGKE